jgi:hypothetical protein
VADEIAHELQLFGFVRIFSGCELFFDQDRQFNNIEPIEPEIVLEVRVNADTFHIETHMLGDVSADLGCKKPFIQLGGVSSQCQDGHEQPPSIESPIPLINSPDNVTLSNYSWSDAIMARIAHGLHAAVRNKGRSLQNAWRPQEFPMRG